MTAADPVDWARAERDEARRQLWGPPLLVAFLTGDGLLDGQEGFWEDGSRRYVFGGAVLLVVLSLLGRTSARLRARSTPALRLQVALQLHVDPGPELRSRADRAARGVAGRGWVSWLLVTGSGLLVLSNLFDGHLVRTVIGGLLIGAAVVGFTRWWRFQVAAGERWVADPPGPPRDPLPPSLLERWTGGRRVGWLLGGLLVLAVVIGAVAGLTS